MMRLTPIIIAAAIASASVVALRAAQGDAAMQSKFDHSHNAYGSLLKQVVRNDLVDYKALKDQPIELDSYLDSLANVSEREFGSWTTSQRFAYLINLYNAQTLRLIVDHYPLKSIKDIGNVLKGPWDQPVVRLFERVITLNDLEHKILRKNYDDPRVHFALVCAAKGCPPLRQEPYTSEQLDAQLEDQGRIFMSDETKNSIDTKRRAVRLSPIFDWFEEDFVKKSGNVLAFVSPYFPGGMGRELLKEKYRVEFTDYDWSLNEIVR